MIAEISGALLVVAVLTACAEALVEWFVNPIWERFNLDELWLRYVSAAVAFVVVFVSGQNLLGEYLPSTPAMVIFGRVLTSLLAGRGATFLRDFFAGQRAKADQYRALKELRKQRWGEAGE